MVAISKKEFDDIKNEFLGQFRRKYYKQANYFQNKNLAIIYDKIKNDFFIYPISKEHNGFFNKNEYLIMLIDNESLSNENFDFSEIDNEIFEILKMSNPIKLKDYIENNEFNFYGNTKITIENCKKIIEDFKFLLKINDKQELLFLLSTKNKIFNNYLFKNLYLGYYTVCKLDNGSDLYIFNCIENIKYEDIFNN